MAFSAKLVRSLAPVHSLRAIYGHGRDGLLCKALSTSLPVQTDQFYRGFPLTNTLSEAITPHTSDLLPVYRVMDLKGDVIDCQQDPKLSDETLLKMYEQMLTLREMDERLYKAQRMGLISFYMMASGEEGTHFGSAAALSHDDPVYAQYREAGVLMWRGYTLTNFMNQCFGNKFEEGKGRQMPVHYGSKECNFQFISSPLATQMPQAPGYAYGLKRAGAKNCVACYFGDGSAQEGDAHAAMNFAAVLKAPVIFFCRNNGYAISTPVEDQYAGDGIVSRACGYGMEGIRVDGNDVLAVYNVVQHARKVAVEEGRPVLIEAITLRMKSHSTSDDQSRYQDMEEVKHWEENNCPVKRVEGYLSGRGLWKQGDDVAVRERAAEEIKKTMMAARSEMKPHLNELFNDVYDTLPPRLQKQREEMWAMTDKYKEHYGPLLSKHEQ